jgi:pimeloyl-ACP methyl ester carboxylesterase
MPFVFVHGVNNRIEDPGYKARQLTTSQFLKMHLSGLKVDGKTLSTVDPQFPYWGDLATKFAWNMASLPTSDMNALGGPGVPDEIRPLVAQFGDELQSSIALREQPVLTLARTSLPKAVLALSEVLIRASSDSSAQQVAAFVTSAQAYAEASPSPQWLAGLTTDTQFVAELVRQVKASDRGAEALGVADSILNPLSAAANRIKAAVSSAADTVLDRTGNLASSKILAWARAPLNATLGRFFGDIFIYLDTRGNKASPGPIPRLILDVIDKSITAGPAGEPLILMGHSLGGVILFDLLSYYRTDIEVDLFITVGSQVSHFEEMKRYKSSIPDIPSALRPFAPRPQNVRHWINVFDEVDIFSYACSHVFSDVDDFKYDTQTYTIKAHGAYFEQDRFYARLRARIDGPLK